MLRRFHRIAVTAALVLGTGAAAAASASAQSSASFPTIRSWVLVGAFQDGSTLPNNFYKCIGLLPPRPDSLRRQARTLSLRWVRDPAVESRPDFGGYRIYRMVNTPDSSQAVLVRRFSTNPGQELSWHFSRVDSASQKFYCRDGLGILHEVFDNVITFVDPDSSGRFVKRCRNLDPQGRCVLRGDSILALESPPGPHDGFLTWYSITFEKKNTTDNDDEDMFLPDSSGASYPFQACDTTGWGFAQAELPYIEPLGDSIHVHRDNYIAAMSHIRGTCPNLNNKLRNLIGPFEPTAGPTIDLERVRVVPNPYRGAEVWDQPGATGVHFINLPQNATIKIYTVAGDLVRVLQHTDPVRDYEIWDMKSGPGKSIASGIYLYRVEALSFAFQSRFVVIR
jgi:hypothetical protein